MPQLVDPGEDVSNDELEFRRRALMEAGMWDDSMEAQYQTIRPKGKPLISPIVAENKPMGASSPFGDYMSGVVPPSEYPSDVDYSSIPDEAPPLNPEKLIPGYQPYNLVDKGPGKKAPNAQDEMHPSRPLTKYGTTDEAQNPKNKAKAGAGAVGGIGVAGGYKQNIGFDLRARFKFLPDNLRPSSDAYLPPDFMQRLNEAADNGEISQDKLRKAQQAFDQYQETVAGSGVAAQRGTQGEARFAQEGEANIANMEADHRMNVAQKQLQLIDRLESSGMLEAAAEKKKQSHIDSQLNLIKTRIHDLETKDVNPFGSGFEMVFNSIASGLGAFSAVLAHTPNYAADAIMQKVNARANQMAQESANQRAGIQGEFNILQVLREDLQNDKAANHAAKLAMIQRAAMEIDAMGNMSASSQTRERSKLMLHQLAMHANNEELALKAELINQAEQMKKGYLSGAGGGLKKNKEKLMRITQAGGGFSMDPSEMKGYTPISWRGEGIQVQGFAPDEIKKGFMQQMEGINQAYAAVNTLDQLSKQGSSMGLWGADAQKQELAQSSMTLALRNMNTGLGALDKGVQELAEPLAIDVGGPWDASQAPEKIRNLRSYLGQLKKQVLDNIQPQVISGRPDVWIDDDGVAHTHYIVYPASGPQSQQMQDVAQDTSEYVPTQSQQMVK